MLRLIKVYLPYPKEQKLKQFHELPTERVVKAHKILGEIDDFIEKGFQMTESEMFYFSILAGAGWFYDKTGQILSEPTMVKVIDGEIVVFVQADSDDKDLHKYMKTKYPIFTFRGISD